MPLKRILTIFFVFICLISCKTAYQPESVKFEDYRLTNSYQQDSGLITLLRPYADSVNRSMNDIVAIASADLEKTQPEGSLGNLMADAMLVKARQLYNMQVEAALINYGGIRLSSVPAGNITRGKIFELSPFDNVIVIQKMAGNILNQLLDHIAAKGGWPVSGMSFQISNNVAKNILVNGIPLKKDRIYNVALLDYVANGGDDCSMLKQVPQINGGYLFRDALISYFSDFYKAGNKISANIENRVSNAE